MQMISCDVLALMKSRISFPSQTTSFDVAKAKELMSVKQEHPCPEIYSVGGEALHSAVSADATIQLQEVSSSLLALHEDAFPGPYSV